MKTVKMFDFYEEGIADALEKADVEDEFYDYEELKNDTAIPWYIVSEEEAKNYGAFHVVVDKVLREAGCKTGEKVFIWISW